MKYQKCLFLKKWKDTACTVYSPKQQNNFDRIYNYFKLVQRNP